MRGELPKRGRLKGQSCLELTVSYLQPGGLLDGLKEACRAGWEVELRQHTAGGGRETRLLT